jgi:hypothetical protein
MDKLETLTMLTLGTDGVDVYARIKQRDLAVETKLPTPSSNDPVWAKMGVIFGEPVEGDKKFFRHATLPTGWKIVPTDHHMYSNLVDDKGRPRAQIGFKAAFYDRWTSISTIHRFRVERLYHERKPAPAPKEIKKGKRYVKYTPTKMKQQRDGAFKHVDMYGWHSNSEIILVKDGYSEDIVEYEHFPTPPCEDDTSVTYRVLDCGKEIFRSQTLPLTDRTVDTNAHYQDLERREISCSAECVDWLVKQGFTSWEDPSAHWD